MGPRGLPTQPGRFEQPLGRGMRSKLKLLWWQSVEPSPWSYI